MVGDLRVCILTSSSIPQIPYFRCGLFSLASAYFSFLPSSDILFHQVFYDTRIRTQNNLTLYNEFSTYTIRPTVYPLKQFLPSASSFFLTRAPLYPHLAFIGLFAKSNVLIEIRSVQMICNVSILWYMLTCHQYLISAFVS